MKKPILFAFIIYLPFYFLGCSDNPASSKKKNGKQDNELPDVKIVRVSQLAGDVATIKGEVLAGGGSSLKEREFAGIPQGHLQLKQAGTKKLRRQLLARYFLLR
jgi:hypothetical protein